MQLLYITALAHNHTPVFPCAVGVPRAATNAQKGIWQSFRRMVSSLWLHTLKRHAEMLDSILT